VDETGYRIGTGTSDATAIIAGAAALVRSKYPHLSAAEVAHRLTATAIDKGPPGRDNQYGYGVLNLKAALTADVPPMPTPTAAATRSLAGPARPVPPPPAPTNRLRPVLVGAGYILLGTVTLGVAIGGYLLVVRRRRG
jgi:subtilisin family serine protease